MHFGICDIDVFNFCSCQVQNFKQVQERPQFCCKLSKSPKAKVKVSNDIVWNQGNIVWNFVRCCEKLPSFVKCHKISSSTGKD